MLAGLYAESSSEGQQDDDRERLTRVRLFWKPLKLMMGWRFVGRRRDRIKKKLLVQAQGRRERSREPPASWKMGEVKTYYG